MITYWFVSGTHSSGAWRVVISCAGELFNMEEVEALINEKREDACVTNFIRLTKEQYEAYTRY